MRLIFVAGGVMSGVGKGIATASIGKILKEYGFDVTAIKIDPYINCDAGTLRPTEHGEVWVTDDGGEIDQDLGTYERFLEIDIPRMNNITTGQVYREIIERERRGEYLGKTVQFIPHVPDEIRRRILEATREHEIALIEIGGTVGDYENLPFLIAARNLRMELGEKNVIFVLVTYLPVPKHIGEMKTKPTQQAIRLLNETGIFPDFLICRSEYPIDDVRRKKIEFSSGIHQDRIISAPDIEITYEVPLKFEEENLGMKILERFGIQPKHQADWTRWKTLINGIKNPKHRIKVAMVGKYVDIGDFYLPDSYISINEALKHAGANLNVGVKIDWIDSKIYERDESKLQELKKYDGIIVPGGFGTSGVEGKIKAIRFARENKIPYLGLCFGLQLAVVEFARHVCEMDAANTTEVNPKTPYPVIDILPTQREILQKSLYGASMRLGAYAAVLKEETKVLELYQKTRRLEKDRKRIENLKKNEKERFRLGNIADEKYVVLERHRHRYEVNPKFIKNLETKGLIFSGYHSRDNGETLMEFIELSDHRYFVATQAHPEFKSRLNDPAPLFIGFVEAALKRSNL
ncbi:MAG: CTP synthase [Candidatus Aenigmarchaeota archaeon]|nr:CTP synthase [Candidatus Aenigmarchaeota archaeon]